MGRYSNTNLYIPSDFAEIENILLLAYNVRFNTNFTLNELKNSNIWNTFLMSMQLDLNYENSAALLYDKIIAYLKEKQELRVTPHGTTINGLTQALQDIEEVQDLSISTANSTLNLFETLRKDSKILAKPEIGTIYLVLQTEKTDDSTSAKIANVIFTNYPAGIELKQYIPSSFFSRTIKVQSKKGNTYNIAFSYSGISDEDGAKRKIELKIEYSYSNNFYGERISSEQIKTKIVENFNKISKPEMSTSLQEVANLVDFPSLNTLRIYYRLNKNGVIDQDYGGYNEIINAVVRSKFEIKEANIVEIKEIK